MTQLICTTCGFDGDRWSDHDIERTIDHTDDLVGFVLQGAAPSLVAEVSAMSVAVDDDPLTTVHSVMHRLDEVAALRRSQEAFAAMTGTVRSLQASGGGVPKASVPTAELDVTGIVGDTQANRRHHGRPWQAVCLYSEDVMASLRAEGHPIEAGAAGENITLSGLDWSRMRGGLTIEIGPVRLRTSSPAAPCHKIGDCFTDRHWDRIAHDDHPGWARWYASVLVGGRVRPGDTVTVSA